MENFFNGNDNWKYYLILDHSAIFIENRLSFLSSKYLLGDKAAPAPTPSSNFYFVEETDSLSCVYGVLTNA